MSVRSEFDNFLTKNPASDLDAEIGRALADKIDEDGTASAVKELRQLIAAIKADKPAASGLDELQKRRAARSAG